MDQHIITIVFITQGIVSKRIDLTPGLPINRYYALDLPPDPLPTEGGIRFTSLKTIAESIGRDVLPPNPPFPQNCNLPRAWRAW